MYFYLLISLALQQNTNESLMDCYKTACDKQEIKPITQVLQQLEVFLYVHLAIH